MLKFDMKVILFLFILPSLLLSTDITWDSHDSFNHNQNEYNRAMNEYVYLKYNKQLKHTTVKGSTVSLGDLLWQDNQESADLTMYYTKAVEYCEDLVMVGRDDWRLPTKDELLEIVDKDRKPRIVESFKHTSAGDYWTSSIILTSSTKAWIVQFSDGFANLVNKSKKLHVRCVNGSNYSVSEWYKREVDKWR
ncbi:DUF1566 domain-containing protein [Sulfurimonas sp.]|nr:DUF1566 domain-containing protein [Sulfurimonas sp.]